MEYRLCISQKKEQDETKVAYAFYNQHSLCVYKKICTYTLDSADGEYAAVCAQALTYFRTFMRNRYYDEHFSELLDEDGARVLCPDRELCEYAQKVKEGAAADKCAYAPLNEFFYIKSVQFEFSADSTLQQLTDGLLK